MRSKISAKYWIKHKMRFLILVLTIMLCTISLVLSGLNIRSAKMEFMEERFVHFGDYDFAVYDMKSATVEEISRMESLKAYGTIYNLGNVRVEEGTSVRAAAYADKESETMYHLTPFRGNYPRKEDEIAMDLAYAKSCGIAPYPGETVMVWKDGVEKQYTVSGIVEIREEGIFGGFKRYPWRMKEENNYVPPLVYFYYGEEEEKKYESVTIYGQVDNKDGFEGRIKKICEKYETDEWFDQRIDISQGRIFPYLLTLGLDVNQIYSMENVEKAIEDNQVQGDFNTTVLIPVLAFLIGLIAILTIYHIMENVMSDRMHHMGIMCSLGMGKKRCLWIILRELILISAVSIVAGLLLANFLYRLTFPILKDLGVGSSQDAFDANEYVKLVTVDPWLLAVGVLGMSIFIVCVIFYCHMRKKTIIELLNNAEVKKIKKETRKEKYISSPMRLLADKINFLNITSFLLVCFGMAATFFGILYYQQNGERNAAETAHILEMNGLEDYSYVAERKNTSSRIPVIQNRHDLGITEKSLLSFCDTDGISLAQYSIVNLSGRIMKPQEWGGAPELLQAREIAPREYTGEDSNEMNREKALHEADLAIFYATGYGEGEEAYQTPFVGMKEEAFSQLQDYVIEGEIDIQGVKSGRRVVLAVSEEQAEDIKSFFSAGDMIILSDVLCDPMAEETDFTAEAIPVGELVYSGTFIIDGNEIPMSGYRYGKRKDMEVEIAAIVAMREDSFCKFYYQNGYVNIFILPQTFAAWELPDVNYTKLSVQLSDTANKAEVAKRWYQLMSDSEGMKSYDSSELVERAKKEKNQFLVIFYQMDIVLILLILFGLIVSLYSHIRRLAPRIAVMRALGMSKMQLIKMIFIQNMLAPLFGVMASFIPVCLFQMGVNHGINVIEQQEGGFAMDDPLLNKWWIKLAGYDLFSENYILLIVILFLVFLALTLIATVPQIYFSRKNGIVADIAKEKF